MQIPASAVEDDGHVYMEKACPEHGSFRPLIAKYAHYYKDFMAFYSLLSKHFPYKRDEVESCAFSTTLECNMKCPICFAGDKRRVTLPQPTLDEIREKLSVIQGKGINFKLTGGESTTREDLAEIIRLVRDSGNFPVMVTNAMKLDNFDYLKSLRDSGLYAIAPWFDTTTDGQIYERMRGADLLAQRRKVLENVQRLGMKLIIFFVCVKGFNEDQLPGMLKMTQEHPELFKIIVLGYMHRGSKGFSEENEYVTDELWEAVANASDMYSSLDELYVAIKLNLLSRAVRNIYHCYNSQSTLMPRSGRAEDGFDIAYWRRVLEQFEHRLSTSPGHAKAYFIKEFLAALLKKGFIKPLADRYIFRKNELADTFIPSNYYWLQFQNLYYPSNYDQEMVRGFCPYLSFNPGLDKKVSFCEYYNLGLHT